ncbi:hypothetical protein CQW23_24070 [Capsicum baccatum]|uniref:Membrane-associated kinase regulator 4 n=1 Tax=Capsicum baccatum TaxID=33114 RepID=A0A2G2VTQ4_CAPBA|nr:hypothetical protein CQW23_24070 [Capsicum baccatum]
MANNPLPLLMDYSDEEDYIDIEVLSSCSYFSSCPNSSPLNREFEFQMASITNNKESTIAPADELFYRGKLLPLHQKSQRIAPFEEDLEEGEEESFCINFLIAPISSASQSCRFKASKAFLKSLFSKSSCCSEDLKVSKKTTPFRNTAKNIEGLSSGSFSAAETKWHPPIKGLSSSSTNSSSRTGGSFSSSSCSFNSNNGFYELNFLKRSNFFTSGFEGSIEAAVAHCKMSLECGWA